MMKTPTKFKENYRSSYLALMKTRPRLKLEKKEKEKKEKEKKKKKFREAPDASQSLSSSCLPTVG